MVTDKKIIESYRRTQNYAKTASEVGVSRQAIERRVLRMRVNGIDLPPVKKQRKLGSESEG